MKAHLILISPMTAIFATTASGIYRMEIWTPQEPHKLVFILTKSSRYDLFIVLNECELLFSEGHGVGFIDVGLVILQIQHHLKNTMPRDLEYERSNIAYSEQWTEERGGGIKCKNYEICKAVLPYWWYECKCRYTCTTCDSLFGKELVFIALVDCPICLESTRGVIQPTCEHAICIKCFERCRYGEKMPRPLFPYSDEIWEEYTDNWRNPKWNIEYPLIKQWNDECNRIDAEEMARYDREAYLRQCPLCRN